MSCPLFLAKMKIRIAVLRQLRFVVEISEGFNGCISLYMISGNFSLTFLRRFEHSEKSLSPRRLIESPGFANEKVLSIKDLKKTFESTMFSRARLKNASYWSPM